MVLSGNEIQKWIIKHDESRAYYGLYHSVSNYNQCGTNRSLFTHYWVLFMNWMNVNDKLPPNYEEVIFTVITDVKRDILIGHRVDDIWYNCYLFYVSTPLNNTVCKVTHWLALPDYPVDMKMPIQPIEHTLDYLMSDLA